jgi:hypothetical protein
METFDGHRFAVTDATFSRLNIRRTESTECGQTVEIRRGRFAAGKRETAEAK